MEKVFIARQPILSAKETIFGYELLFRKAYQSTAIIDDDHQATATVMMNALNNFGFTCLVGKRKGFINVNDKTLASGFVDLLPKEASVLEILETQKPDGDFIDLCRMFKKKGYSFALDDFIYDRSFHPLLELADYVKFDLLAQDRKKLSETVQVIRKYPARLVAEKVETKEDFEFCRDLGFELFQGFFFAKPSVISTKSLSPSQIILLELFNGLAKEKELNELEKLFKKSPQLDLKLLTFINSAGFYLMQKVTSIRQAMMLLGYKNLQKWVTLLLFAQDVNDFRSNPLLEKAAIRGLMMESIAKKITANRMVADSAFIVGILSLSCIALGITMEDLVMKLNLGKDLQDALVNRTGLLGAVLLITEKAERDELNDVQDMLKQYKLSVNAVLSSQTDALFEYESIGTEGIC